jgi:hypothetical protein
VVKDPARLRTKLVAFNEADKILGEIDTGEGSLFQGINGSPIVLINALGFDPEGNGPTLSGRAQAWRRLRW